MQTPSAHVLPNSVGPRPLPPDRRGAPPSYDKVPTVPVSVSGTIPLRGALDPPLNPPAFGGDGSASLLHKPMPCPAPGRCTKKLTFE
ncbi:hypothetical protein M3J09_008684 [Ascochyta lentis]